MKIRHLLCLGALLFAGCQNGAAPTGGSKPPPPEVSVAAAVTATVTDYEDFPGRMEAVNAVELRARVTGYLDKFLFKEGEMVTKGEVLFEIDPRPYKAEFARSEGNITVSDGHLKRLEADYKRAQNLFPMNAISKEDFDKIAGDRIEATGALETAKAARDMAKLNLDWTKVKSPLTGRISQRFISPGNLVKADETILTTIVDLDPIYAFFDLDERTALRLQKLIREGRVKWSVDAGLPVYLGLSDEEGFPRKGTINFADNKVDPDTGTWRLRATYENKDLSLSPGLFVRVRLPIGNPYETVLVAEQALGTDQSQKFLFVVDEHKMVTYRRVKVGRQHHGMRAIAEGLKPGEQVIVSGLQRARQGIEVNPKVITMPTAADIGAEQKPASKKDN